MARSNTTRARAVAVVCAAVLALTLVGMTDAGAKNKPKPTVKVATAPGVGVILVDSQGKALYTLTDATGAAVACTGGCATAWPPLTVAGGAKAKGGKGVTKLGTTSDGQVTWNSLPVYRFAGDAKPKQPNGDGISSFGGTWHVVKIKAAKAKTTATTTGGYSGY